MHGLKEAFPAAKAAELHPQYASHTGHGGATIIVPPTFPDAVGVLLPVLNWQVSGEELYIVVNAGCREKDLAHIGKHLKDWQVGYGSCATIVSKC